MSRITIHQGYEYRTYISDIYAIYENKDQDENIEGGTYYYPQYMQAAKCIDEITMRMMEFNEDRNSRNNGNYLSESAFENDGSESYSNDHSWMGYPNNIIGFCAKRGQGKTSTMLAMVRALMAINPYKNRSVVNEFWNNAHKMNLAVDMDNEMSPVLTTKYFALGTIDPTTMEKSDSILEIIIARMLQKVWKQRKDLAEFSHNEKPKETEMYRELLKKFQDVSQKVRALKQKRADEYDDILKISETDDNRSTKYAFVELVNLFLEYIGKDMIIVPVDDADLDPQRVYEVAEDLRKYCVVPGVIVMMAVHLDTLRTCIEQRYVENYKYLLRSEYTTDHMKQYQCREMAERYVDKLIPDLHQVHLPYFHDRIQDGMDIKLFYFSQMKDENGRKQDLLGRENVPVFFQDRLMRLIYEKTGIILIEKPGYLHNFMPKRYRELTHMLSFFTRMMDIDISGKFKLENLIKFRYLNIPIEGVADDEVEQYLEIRIQNMDQMENYFFQHWCAVYLTKNQCDKLNRLRDAPLDIKNIRTMEILKAYCESDHKDEFIKEESEKNSCFYLGTNVSFADVLDALSQVKKRLNSQFKYDFVYAIQMYYTIYMNKIICRCLKRGDGFDDLRKLTNGLIMPFDDKYSVVKKVEKYKKMIQPERWLVPCDDKGYLNPYNIDQWYVKNDRSLADSEYYRFDPFLYLFFCLSEFYKKVILLSEQKQTGKHMKGYMKHNNEDAIIEIKRDIEERIPSVVVALQYLCNYDLQYFVKKNTLKYLQFEHDVRLAAMSVYVGDQKLGVMGIFSVLKGKKGTKQIHSLPICCTEFKVQSSISYAPLVNLEPDSDSGYKLAVSVKSDDNDDMESMNLVLDEKLNSFTDGLENVQFVKDFKKNNPSENETQALIKTIDRVAGALEKMTEDRNAKRNRKK